jgi:uncharacterized SAM-binding protein YcdF (DUF218 family)
MSEEASDRLTDTAARPERPARRRRGLRRGAGLITLLAAAAAIGLGIGFVGFVGRVTAEPGMAAPAKADGIVVFTGGRDRIAVAARLLADGKGRRLLISGVNPATPRRDLEGLSPEIQPLSDCCIDLGREAEDTIGNALETAAWARDHGFATLLVVTSAYHLPRSLTELESALPEASLTGVPVASEGLSRPWWRDRHVARLLIAEYTKYLASLARLAVSGGAAGDRPDG